VKFNDEETIQIWILGKLFGKSRRFASPKRKLPSGKPSRRHEKCRCTPAL